MDRRWFSNSRLLPNMTTFFSNSYRQWRVLAPLFPVARIHQTQVGSLFPLTRRFHLNRIRLRWVLIPVLYQTCQKDLFTAEAAAFGRLDGEATYLNPKPLHNTR
ncbi:unnamed protein product [Boreogadus saida]